MSETPSPRPFEEPASVGDPRLDALGRLLAIIDRLRAPDGCPWDRKQTMESMAPSLIEEAHEAVEAIEQQGAAAEELGDLLMVIGLIAQIASSSDSSGFDMTTVAQTVGDKLLRRHPHVFGDVEVTGSEHVIANWEKIKQAEREEKDEDASVIAGVPVSMPGLQRAHRLGAKAIAAGFRWNDRDGAFAKVEEELVELREATTTEETEAELGDLLLAGALLGNYLDVDPERALRGALRRFEARFRSMEERLEGPLREAELEQMLAAWKAAKEAE